MSSLKPLRQNGSNPIWPSAFTLNLIEVEITSGRQSPDKTGMCPQSSYIYVRINGQKWRKAPKMRSYIQTRDKILSCNSAQLESLLDLEDPEV